MDKYKEEIINEEIKLLNLKILDIDREIGIFKGCKEKLTLDDISYCECGVNVNLCHICERKLRMILNKKIKLQNSLIFFLSEWKLSKGDVLYTK